MDINEWAARQENEKIAGESLVEELFSVLDKIQNCAGGTVKWVEDGVQTRLMEIDPRTIITDHNPTDDFRVKFLEDLSSYLFTLAMNNIDREV